MLPTAAQSASRETAATMNTVTLSGLTLTVPAGVYRVPGKQITVTTTAVFSSIRPRSSP
jgi:hypothetical protein